MKDTIRKEMLLIRKNISNKKSKSKVIETKLLNLEIYKKTRVVAIYNSMKDEVSTNYLIKESLKSKIVLLPKIINNKMIFIKIDRDTKYQKSPFKILEPIGREYIDKIDLIIVPGVSFDRYLNRLGYGKGYYDKYLANSNSYKIGICFDEQITNDLPVEETDIKMNLVITEKEFYN